MLSVKQGGFKYHFLVFDMTPPGIEPRSPEPLVNTRWHFTWKPFSIVKGMDNTQEKKGPLKGLRNFLRTGDHSLQLYHF